MDERARHATKVGLAMVIAYGLPMAWGWLNPHWAAISVAFCALTTRGESLNKSSLRLVGTLVGVIAAFLILGLFPQSRWGFVVVVSIYCAVVTYLMTGSSRPYIWHVAGFVCLIITLTGPTEPAAVFVTGVARGYETAFGCITWALVDLLLWPVTNRVPLEETRRKLVDVQRAALARCSELSRGRSADTHYLEARTELVGLINQLHTHLAAAGAESVEVRELRPLWVRLESEYRALLSEVDRWYLSARDVATLDIANLLPDLEAALARLATGDHRGELNLAPQTADLASLTRFDRVAVRALAVRVEAVVRRVASLEAVHAALNAEGQLPGEPQAGPSRHDTLIPDPDRVRAAVFVFVTVWMGYLLWIFFDPPGHASLYMMPPAVAMATALAPHMMMARGILRAFVVYLPVALAVYLLVMPGLSGFTELAIVIFGYMFWVHYSLTSPLASLAASLGFVTLVAIDNEQAYSFVGAASGYLFMLIAVLIVIACSYLLMSPRPEKMFVRLLARYLGSAAFVLARQATPGGAPPSVLERYRIRFHHRELSTLPGKLDLWGGQIDHEAFTGNDKGRVDRVVTAVHGLSYCLQDFVTTRTAVLDLGLDRAFNENTRTWRTDMAATLAEVNSALELYGSATIDQQVRTGLMRLEAGLTDDVVESPDESEQNCIYDLLAACRGLASGVTAYVAAAGAVDWGCWREERF